MASPAAGVVEKFAEKPGKAALQELSKGSRHSTEAQPFEVPAACFPPQTHSCLCACCGLATQLRGVLGPCKRQPKAAGFCHGINRGSTWPARELEVISHIMLCHSMTPRQSVCCY